MSDQVVSLYPVAQRADSAWAAFVAVYRAAKRLGHAHRPALETARAARAGVLCGRTSAAGAIANLKQDLRGSARRSFQ
ncbi:hypothetical protein AB8810_10935 [Xanthomonas sp. NCPPB 3005]|uniref:hypothetical protein n=1 Tax=Xanthomonas sp. NCPPB 3005 TaxID=3240913 RepID=UPI003514BA4C